MKLRRGKKPVQLDLPTRSWGGWRKGAGRPRVVGGVSHAPRPELAERYPVHVTLSVRSEVGNLRDERVFAAIQEAFLKGHDRFGMRMVLFSVQWNHIQMGVEAAGKKSLTRGIQGLSIRLARAINRALGRRGRVFADRYHARTLKTPTEVRNAVAYVQDNYRKHRERFGRSVHPFYIDPYSSMSGRACCYMLDYDRGVPVVASPRTWLLNQALTRAA